MSTDSVTTPPSGNTQANDEFAQRHSEELGVKKFFKVKAAYSLIPLATMAIGGALGYFALARPIAKLMPGVAKTAGAVEVGAGRLGDAISSLLNGESVHEAFRTFSPTAEQLQQLSEVLKEGKTLRRSEQISKAADILKLELPAVPKTLRLITAGSTAFLGGMVGGTAVGYDQWRKEESARLAAQEINRDISNLELFRPSDAELLAENKRLSSMVAALPTIDTASAQSQGRVSEHQKSVAV